jgi:hypothetical protein
VVLAEGTVVAIKPDASFDTSDGGKLRDPIPLPRSLCILASETYLKPRKSVRMVTGRRISGIAFGSMLSYVNGIETNSVTMPLLDGERSCTKSVHSFRTNALGS